MAEITGILKDLYAVIDRNRCDMLDCDDCSFRGSGNCYEASIEAGERVMAWLNQLPEGAISRVTIEDLL